MLADARIGLGDCEAPAVVLVGTRRRILPQREYRIDGVDRDLTLDACLRIDASYLEIARKAARTDAPQEPTAGELVEHGDAVGEVERVVVGQAAHARAELDVARA